MAALFQRTVAAHKAGRMEDAEEGYRAILQRAPDEAQVHYLLGTIFMATDRSVQAIAAFRQCIHINKAHSDALNAMGSLLSKDGQYDEAIQALVAASNLSPQNASIWFNLGHAYVDKKQYKNGADAFKRSIEIHSDYWNAFNGYGLCLGEMGQVDEAIDLLKRCLEQEPTLKNADINLIRYLVQSEQFNEALDRSQTAIEQWPDVVQFYVFKSVAHQHFKEQDLALEALEKAIELEPENTFALNHMSNYLYALGQWKDAETHCLKSLELEPDSPKSLNNLGRVRLMRGDLDNARSFYQRALEIDSEFSDVHNNLGNLFLYTDQLEDSLKAFDRAIELSPEKKNIGSIVRPLACPRVNLQVCGEIIVSGLRKVIAKLNARVGHGHCGMVNHWTEKEFYFGLNRELVIRF